MSQAGLGGERRYSVPSNPMALHDPRGMQSEDLHAWSIYRQNLNSDFTDSALGSTDKSPLPYGNFQLRDTTVQSILAHPRYGPKSALGSNMYTYLKFGLPRVFPPNHNGSQRSGTPKPKISTGSNKPIQRISRYTRGARETSSGYDSSDNETSMQYKHNRKYRSDPDFRMQNLHPSYQHTGVPLVAMHQAGIRDSQWGGVRNKSISEANLLAMENRQYGSNRQAYGARRSSVAELGHEMDHQSYLMAASQLGRPMSKADSHLSLAHSRKSHQVPSTLRGADYLDGNGVPHVSYIYPNLQVNDLEIATPESRNILLVAGLSFEVKAGELLAVLATAQNEATALLNVLAGVDKKLSGEVIMNGQPISKSTLHETVAYVRNDVNLNPDMTVEQTLQFHAQLRWPNTKMSQIRVEMNDRINILIEELGLEQVHSTTVGRLTRSELRRLNVACQLLLDTVILILDQPTKEMDIFDTFFLIEYLRNWASTGRIVIMTLHPPTYEIFAMITKVVLLSAGRTMFSGHRRDMLPYFSSIDYPCPSFKNPSDYYLDLVTLDELSAAAMLESSARIEQLAGAARALPRPSRAPHHPPAPLPASLVSANAISQMFTLFKMNIYYTQPNTIVNWIVRLIMTAVLSIITGAVFWDLPSSDAQLGQNDRQGYHYAVMCLTVIPILIITGAMPVWSKRKCTERDISVGLYGRTTLILSDIITDIPSSVCIWLAFLIPSYAMTGLYIQGSDDYNGFYLYLGYMLLYLLGLQMLVKAIAHLIPRSRVSLIFSGILLILIFLSGGYILHRDDLPDYTLWLEYVSPTRWTMPYILRRELSPEAIHSTSRCKHKQIQRQDIIVQLPCPQLNGTQSLANYAHLELHELWDETEISTVVSLAVFWVVFTLIAGFSFIIDCCNFKRRSERRMEKSNKTNPNSP